MSVYIHLTKGCKTLVDDDMVNELCSYLWYASGYQNRPARRLKEPPRRLIYMYHQILRVNPWELKGLVVDHINGDPLDNRKENLRIVSENVNMQNSDRHKTRRGYCFSKTENKYKAYLDMPDKPRVWLGTYKTIEGAQKALTNAIRELGIEDHPHA